MFKHYISHSICEFCLYLFGTDSLKYQTSLDQENSNTMALLAPTIFHLLEALDYFDSTVLQNIKISGAR